MSGHHAGVVHAQRHVPVRAALVHLPVANDAAGVLHRYLALRLGDGDDPADHHEQSKTTSNSTRTDTGYG